MPPADRTTDAVTGTPVEHARAAVGAEVRAAAGAGSQDPLIGDLRKGGLLPLLVLHFTARSPATATS